MKKPITIALLIFLESISLVFSQKRLPKTTAARPAMYIIKVINSKEPTIGHECYRDKENISNLFEQIAATLEIELKQQTVTGKDFGKANVLKAIANIHPGKDDIVVFYYSGHGFRFKGEKDRPFPQLDLRTPPPVYSAEVINASTQNAEEILDLVKAKGARLNIVLGDCCNAEIEFYRRFPNEGGMAAPPTLYDKQVTEMLFLKTQGSLLMTAAKKGQYAVADELKGGIFTFEFNDVMETFLLDPDAKPSWKEIFDMTRKKTKADAAGYDCKGIGCVQEPIYVIKDNKGVVVNKAL